MRWLLVGALAVSVLGCGDKILGPTSTLDGVWAGASPGYTFTLTLTQTDTVISGTAVIAGIGGFANFDVEGTMVSHVVKLNVFTTGFDPMKYDATLSTSQAVMDGTLDGSGFNKLVVSFHKR
jgi:hypothetical protein